MKYIIVEEPLSKGVTCATLANSLRKQYYCEKCNGAFSKLYYLRLHMKSHAFRCAFCSRRYFYKSLLRKHIHSEHTISIVQEEEKTFKCEKCSNIFLTEHEYKYHQWTDHLYKFPCIKINCRMAFRTKEEYDDHKKKMHPDKFHCSKKGCHKIFKTKEEYNSHKKQSHRVKFETKEEYNSHKKQSHRVKFQCSKNDYVTQSHLVTFPCSKKGCPMVFKRKEQLDRHRKLSHVVKFECSKIGSQMVLRKRDNNDNQSFWSRCKKDGCQKIFKTQKEYDKHIASEHLKQCKICGKRMRAMERHMRIHLPKSCVCKICNKHFRYLEDVRKHMLIHLKIKQFKCQHCGKSFTQKGNLTSHERIHTGIRPFKCKMCTSSFYRKDHLSSHEKGVHGGKEARKFSCDKCKFSAVTQTKLNHHKNHYHQKIFKCEKCSAVLRCQKSLDRHSSTHSEEKPFPCYYCVRSYATKFNYIKHLKKKHSGKSVEALV